MRKYLHLARQVQKQVELRMGEVFSSFLLNADNQIVEELQQSFECHCTYCRLHIEYTYFCMQTKRSPLNMFYLEQKRKLKEKKETAVQFFSITEEHIKKAHIEIGAHFYRYNSIIKFSFGGKKSLQQELYKEAIDIYSTLQTKIDPIEKMRCSVETVNKLKAILAKIRIQHNFSQTETESMQLSVFDNNINALIKAVFKDFLGVSNSEGF